MTRRLILAAIAAAAFIPGATAHAATVSYTVDSDGDEEGYVETRSLVVTAAGAETNDMSITVARDGFLVRDAAAPLSAKAPCAVIDQHTVRCAVDVLGGRVPADREGLYAGAQVDLGAGDDRLSYESALDEDDESTVLRGGAGSDSVTAVGGNVSIFGGEGADSLRGTATADVLVGGAGPDVLDGGEGDDHLTGDDDGIGPPPFAAPASDTISGGPGSDTVSYAGHRAAVTVDLSDPGPHGAAGEQDRLNSIENAIGGAGDDVLRGTAGGDTLEGRDGTDTLVGRAGNDELNGETIDAGPGRDLIVGLDRRRPVMRHRHGPHRRPVAAPVPPRRTRRLRARRPLRQHRLRAPTPVARPRGLLTPRHARLHRETDRLRRRDGARLPAHPRPIGPATADRGDPDPRRLAQPHAEGPPQPPHPGRHADRRHVAVRATQAELVS